MCGIYKGQSFEEEARKLREEDEGKHRQQAESRRNAREKQATGKAKDKARELVNS